MSIRLLFAILLPSLYIGTAIAATVDNMLVITQSATESGEEMVSAVTAYQGLSQGPGNLKILDTEGQLFSDTSGIPQLAVRKFGKSLTRPQLAGQAKLHIVGRNYPDSAGAMKSLVAALMDYMKKGGVGVVTFNFNQKVIVAGDAAPRYLLWTLVLEQGKRPVFVDPQVVDAAPTILHVRYTPKRIAGRLPHAWAFADAGTLKWRKLDPAYAPLTPWMSIDVAGAYDEPIDVNGAEVDKDLSIACLIRRDGNKKCPTATNVMDLMKQTESVHAILDYGRTFQLASDSVENPPGSGKFEQAPRVVMSVDYREWNVTGCAVGAYVNRGVYGFELNNVIDRYAIWLDRNYRLLNSFENRAVSPTTPFDVSKAGIANATAAYLTDKVIDAANPSGPLLMAKTVPNLINIVPITSKSTGETTQVLATYYHGQCGRAFGITAQCDANGNVQLTFGVSSAVPNCTAGTDFYQTQTYTLRRGSPVSQISKLDQAGSFTWRYDGDRTVLFRHSDVWGTAESGIRIGMTVFASQMFYPSKGHFVRQNFPTGGPVDFYFERAECPDGSVSGDSIFKRSMEGFAWLQPLCFRVDPAGPYNVCAKVKGTIQCANYRQAGAKVWLPSQRDPGTLPAATTDVVGRQ